MTSATILFSSKTEQSRIVTIHRPMVITQERKTPAYFVYQQMQNLEQQKRNSETIQLKPTTYLSSQSAGTANTKVQISEMKFDKKDFMAPAPTIYQMARAEFQKENRSYAITNKTYEQVFAQQVSQDSFNQYKNDETSSGFSEKKWATVRGKFELIDGVGVVDHIIELKRIEEGRIRETGIIDLKSGLYSIDIESPKGYLLARIKDKNGLLIGEDRERIINLRSRGSFYEGPFLQVGHPETLATNPYFPGSSRTASMTTATYKSLSSNTADKNSAIVTIFDNAKTFDNPQDSFSNVSSYASTISRVFDPSHIYKNMISIRHTGDKSETPMFTSSWLNGVTGYISDIKKIEFKNKNGPILMGRILSKGKPVSGAEIQIASAPGLLPIYFDQFMIPTFNQTTTTENGYFMFMGVEADNYEVVVSKNGISLGSQLFIAEQDSIAFQNITISEAPKTKILRSFDGFSGLPIQTDVVVAESDEALAADNGVLNLKSYSDNGIDEYLVRTEDRQYIPVRYIQSTRKDYVHIPMIKESWLETLKSTKNIFAHSNTGIIIGFTTELEYDAYLAEENHDKNDIVYFDSRGNYSETPVVGGGFVLFNVPVGAQEIVLQDKNTDKIYSQVFNIKAQQVSISHFLVDL